jgi:hypothetical protein
MPPAHSGASPRPHRNISQVTGTILRFGFLLNCGQDCCGAEVYQELRSFLQGIRGIIGPSVGAGMIALSGGINIPIKHPSLVSAFLLVGRRILLSGLLPKASRIGYFRGETAFWAVSPLIATRQSTHSPFRHQAIPHATGGRLAACLSTLFAYRDLTSASSSGISPRLVALRKACTLLLTCSFS